MRIFFAVPRSAWVDLNLRRSLEDMGHELVRFDFPGWPDDADTDWQRTGKPSTNERLLKKFKEAGHVDLFYGYFYSSVVYPETIDLIRQSGVPTVNFSCNNVHQFDLVRDIAPHFDLCIVPEQAALADFLEVGARPVRIQLAANPCVYRPLPEPRIYDVTFVGQRYADRADFLTHLYENGVDVRAWGAGWAARKRLNIAHAKAALALIEDERFDGVRRLLRRSAPSNGNHASAQDTRAFGGPRLLQSDLVKMFSQSRLSLGFATAGESHLWERRLTHLRLREFEAPMSGALYLTEDQPELHEYFEPGKEVLTYTNQQDLLETSRYYLAHQEQSERIRRAGWRRALHEHTWQHRFRELFAALGLSRVPMTAAERLGNDPTSELWGEHRSRYRFAAQFAAGKQVLDVATGSGFGLQMLVHAGACPIGVDYDPLALTGVRHLQRTARLVHADATCLPFHPNAVDLVVSFETIEHVPNAQALVSEVRRVLKPGGRLVLSTPNRAFGPDERHTQNPFHVREFTADELRNLLRASFDAVQLYGQRPSPAYRYVPYLMVEPRYEPASVVWRVLTRLPFPIRNSIALMISGRPFYPSEEDYDFVADSYDDAHALLAVAH